MRVVSAPSLTLFDRQSRQYKEEILGIGIPVLSVEVCFSIDIWFGTQTCTGIRITRLARIQSCPRRSLPFLIVLNCSYGSSRLIPLAFLDQERSVKMSCQCHALQEVLEYFGISIENVQAKARQLRSYYTQHSVPRLFDDPFA